MAWAIASTGISPLKEIDKVTVKRPVSIWNFSLDNPWGRQAQPLVLRRGDVCPDAKATVAMDVGPGKQIWRNVGGLAAGNAARRVLQGLQQGCHDPQRQALPYHARCPVGARSTWRDRQGDLEPEGGRVEGKATRCTAPPLIANSVLITGSSGAEFGVRGFIDGWEPGNRQTPVASLTSPATRRTRQRDLAASTDA